MTASDNGEEIAEVLLLRRFLAPTEDDVVKFLQEKASMISAEQSSPNYVHSCQGKSDLERMLNHLPPTVLQDIVAGNQEIVYAIKSLSDALPDKCPTPVGPYLEVVSGMMPRQPAEQITNTGLSAHYAYRRALKDEKLLKRGFGKKWEFQIFLPGGKLPAKEELYVLMRHGTTRSITLGSPQTYDFRKASKIMDALYATLTKPKQLAQVPDFSAHFTESYATKPIEIIFKEMILPSVIAACSILASLQEERPEKEGKENNITYH